MRARNKPASRRRRKRVLKGAKGFVGGKSRLFRTATERLNRALRYAYRDRRTKKRDFRQLWITRIGAAARINGISYSRFMSGLKRASVAIDRKNLAELAVNAPQVFKEIVDVAKSKLAA